MSSLSSILFSTRFTRRKNETALIRIWSEKQEDGSDEKVCSDACKRAACDVTHVKSVETVKEDGKAEAAGWDIDVTEDEAPVIEEIAKIYDWVAAKGKSAVSYFPEETQQAISALLPEGFKLENMMMNEFVTLTLTGDVDVLNDAKVTFTFTTKYTQDQHVVAVIGLYDGTRDANGQYVVTWIPLEAEVM